MRYTIYLWERIHTNLNFKVLFKTHTSSISLYFSTLARSPTLLAAPFMFYAAEPGAFCLMWSFWISDSFLLLCWFFRATDGWWNLKGPLLSILDLQDFYGGCVRHQKAGDWYVFRNWGKEITEMSTPTPPQGKSSLQSSCSTKVVQKQQPLTFVFPWKSISKWRLSVLSFEVVLSYSRAKNKREDPGSS